MPRKKNDGRGRLGGRQAGTPNKSNPIKTLLHQHSEKYFSPCLSAEEVADIIYPTDGVKDKNIQQRITKMKESFVKKHSDELFSQYDCDLLLMKASDRAKIEVDLLAYHQPKMQAISADMLINTKNQTLTNRLIAISEGKDPKDPDEE